MPAAAINMDQLTVDQSLVDAYLARVDRFCNNVSTFETTLKELTNNLKETIAERFRPEPTPEQIFEEEIPQEMQMEQMQETIDDPLVTTADDIDLDALLADVNLDDGLQM